MHAVTAVPSGEPPPRRHAEVAPYAASQVLPEELAPAHFAVAAAFRSRPLAIRCSFATTRSRSASCSSARE